MTSDSGMRPPRTNPTPIRTRFWTAKEVAQNLGMSLRWVRQAAADGRLPCIRHPDLRAVRFDPAEVRAWFVARQHRVALANAVEKAFAGAAAEGGVVLQAAACRTETRRKNAGRVGVGLPVLWSGGSPVLYG